MAKVIKREESDERVNEIDKEVKNKFKWNWLERSVNITYRNQKGLTETDSFTLGTFIRKVDKSGVALCITCDKLINYGSKGAMSLEEHCSKARKHAERMTLSMTNTTLGSFISTPSTQNKEDSTYGVHPSVTVNPPAEKLQPLVPMCDRISNSECMVLGFIAEHSLSLSMVPELLDLAKSLALDKAALGSLEMCRHTASYKMTHGLALTFREELLENLRRYPFSINIDESTSNNNKRILAVLVSFFLPEEGVVKVEHLSSLEVIKVDSESLYKAIDELFTSLDIPWANLVSSLLDSCNVMRGSKSGVELRLRNKAPQLLDIDGDSCHHIHNSCKKFCAPFGKWIEELFRDIYNDFKWSADLKEWLQETCEILHIKFTVPPNYVSHRWLSVYDVALATKMLINGYTVLYFGFIPKTSQATYTDVFNKILEEKSVSREGRQRINEIHQLLAGKWKSLTVDGKERKNRILEKIFYQQRKTKLFLNFYISALPLLQAYVKVFQSRDSLIHELHDRQLDTFQQFLVCFVKPEVIANLSAKQLKQFPIKTDNGQFLKMADMFVGDHVTQIRKECRKDDKVVVDFEKRASSAYIECAAYMQSKLPLHSELLRALSCIDPTARGHTVAVKGLKKLANHMEAFLSHKEQDAVQFEILKFQVDRKVPDFTDESDVAQWWSQVTKLRTYPALSKLAGVALSIFHGPQVESSFSLMQDIIDPKSSRLNVETFSAIQIVKYSLMSKKTKATEYFRRPDSKYTPVNRRLCQNMRSAAQLHKRLAAERLEARMKTQERLKLKKGKLVSKAQNKIATEKSVEQARQLHMEKQRKAARKRALEDLSLRAQKNERLL